MKMKGVLAAILTAVLCISGNVLAVLSGDGTEGNPYLIQSQADFDEFADPANSATYWASGVYTTLMCNLSLSGTTYTQAVIAPDIDPMEDGFQGTEFTGVFDGDGHTISNLTITCTDRDRVGLFGYFSSGGQIKNLGVVDVNIQGANRVGGLVGESWDGIITSCYVTGSVSGTNYGIGGLVGENYGPITSSYAMATVSGGGSVGGLIGEGGSSITSCYATGSVNGTGDNVGGLAGFNDGQINFCYATGAVNGTGRYVGGLVGSTTDRSVTSCFWDVWTSGQSNSSGGKGLNPDQMKTLTIYQNAGWADKGWVMNDGVDYPRLSWEGTGYAAIPSAVIPFAGNGTEANPYRITTAQEFALLSCYLGVLDKHIKLEANLDLSGITLYSIGDLGSFTGVFDGNGHTISNATILSDSNYAGIFASLGNMDSSGQINNLGIANANIQGYDNVGGLVGGFFNSSTITSCYVTGTVSGHSSVGGLVGCNLSSTIESCYVTGDVSGYDSVGGLLGWNSFGTIESCHATGTVSQAGSYSAAGGLVGANEFGLITSCYATGAVNGTGYYVGGLVGDSVNGTITSCNATGAVNGENSYTGGLVGHINKGTITSCYATGVVSVTGTYGVGGLIGGSWDGLITLCYATGTVSGNYSSGGLVGLNNYTTIESCYATGAVSGGPYVGGLVGNSAGTITSCYAMGAVNGKGGADYVGGLIGYNGGGNITSCYATGLVNATNVHVGGLVGYFYYGTFTSCFWDTQTSNQPTSTGGTGKTTAQMMTLSTFTNASWDFITTDGDPADWMMLQPTEDYPRLAWQTIYPGDIAGLYGVNYVDFAVFAAHWEQTGCPTGCDNADINKSGTVDISDLTLFVDNWLKGI